MRKVALITGITGMDGSHLAEFLLEKNYIVFGMERWKSNYNYDNLSNIIDKVTLIKGDLTDQQSINRIIKQCNPDEIYNLASQSFVGDSWDLADLTLNVTGLGVLKILEAIKDYNKNIKFFQASSSEMFAKSNGCIDENGNICPVSPYGISKTAGHLLVNAYRNNYNLFAVSGIMFNHESERRNVQFVTRKITNAVAKIYLGLQDKILLGNLDSERDWGYAPDYVKGMWASLQHQNPGNYIFATGQTKTIAQLVETAFGVVGIENWQKYVGIDPKFYRPYDKRCISGNISKAKTILDWNPETSFDDWVKIMVENDINLLKNV